MIVISDTSPLNYLILVGAIDVLPTLFEEIHVPTEVMDELLRSRAPQPVKLWAQTPHEWLRISDPRNDLVASVALDPGEAQAIALTKELRADAILIDDRMGRRVAKQHGLNVVGTLAVLEYAAQKNLLDLRRVPDALRQTTFHISDALIDAALKRNSAKDA